MDKTNLLNELHELLYLTAKKFVKKHNLSIQSIYFDCDEMVIVENASDTNHYLFEETYKFKNDYLNKD